VVSGRRLALEGHYINVDILVLLYIVLLMLFLTAKSSDNLPSTGSDLYSGKSHEDGSQTGWHGSVWIFFIQKMCISAVI